ncbi:MAG: DUF5630 domain-containing protein [Proteobacteria bacterium]|nr:DUF5630 domain-containing protein [Pseudomonadota bacterium]
MRSNLFKLEWRDQPGDFKALAIKQGFNFYWKTYNNFELDEKTKLAELKVIAEKYHSYHAASAYANMCLLKLSPNSPILVEELKKITSWYSSTMMIHGSPTFYYLATVCSQYAEIATDSKAQNILLVEAYTYIQAGLALKEMSEDALFNAYLGRSFSAIHLRFNTPEELQSYCLKALHDVPNIESAKQQLIDRYLCQIHTHRKNELLPCDL